MKCQKILRLIEYQKNAPNLPPRISQRFPRPSTVQSGNEKNFRLYRVRMSTPEGIKIVQTQTQTQPNHTSNRPASSFWRMIPFCWRNKQTNKQTKSTILMPKLNGQGAT
jgi:hypothetical protein